MIPRSFVSKAAGALAALAILAFSDRAVAEQLTGQVSAVDAEGNKLIVKETETGKDVTVAVGDATPIMTSEGKRLVLKDLKKGDGVGISHIAGVAREVLVNVKAPELLGKVSALDTDERTLTVTREGSEKDVKVKVDDKTPIVTAKGKTLRFEDLKQGDGVNIIYSGDTPSRIVVNVKPQELTGHVKSVGADLKSFVVTEVGTKKDITVVVTGKTAIVTNDGKKIELKALKKGDGVGIAHDASVASKVVVDVKAVE